MKEVLITISFIALVLFASASEKKKSKEIIRAGSYVLEGDSCKKAEKFEEAIKNYQEAVRLYEKENMPEKTADIFHSIGKVYRMMGNYEKALENDIKSLRINENIQDKKNIALNLNNIGIDFHRMANYEKALEYLTTSLHLREEIMDSIGIADSYLNMGMVYDEKGETDKGLEYYYRSLEFYEQTTDLDGMAACYNNIAGIYYQKGDLDNVLEYALKSLDIQKKFKNKRNISFNMINIGLVYNAQKNHDLAISYIEEGLVLAKEVGAKPLIQFGYESLSIVYASMKDYEKAYNNFQLYNDMKDTIFREESARAFAEMQTKYETEKKEQENQILKKDIKIQTDFKRFLFVITAGLIIMLVFLFYLFRLKSKSFKQSKTLLIQEKELNRLEMARKETEKKHLEDKIFAEKQLNRLQKEKYEAELEHKNNELANSALCIVNKNEVLSRIKEKVLLDKNTSDIDNFLFELIRMINNNIDIDQNWKKFKIKFEEVHPGFFDRLKENYPGLTDIYIKLCAFLRIDLPTKEIAKLTNVTVAATKKSRQRLKKKFDLPTDTSLTEFIKNI